jgi:hypothetical protein
MWAIFHQYLWQEQTYKRHILWIRRRVWRIRISKKNRQHNGQKKKYKSTNNDLQNITHKTKDRVTRTSLKTEVELRCPGVAELREPTIAVPIWPKVQYELNMQV